MAESHQEMHGGPHFKEVGYNDIGAQLTALAMVAAELNNDPRVHCELVTMFHERLGEFQSVMVEGLIYTDSGIAAEREWHLKQPWTD